MHTVQVIQVVCVLDKDVKLACAQMKYEDVDLTQNILPYI